MSLHDSNEFSHEDFDLIGMQPEHPLKDTDTKLIPEWVELVNREISETRQKAETTHGNGGSSRDGQSIIDDIERTTS